MAVAAVVTERRKPGRPPAALVFWASVILFAGLFALLTYRMSTASEASAPAPVQVRKVIKRRVVTTIVPTPGADTVTAGAATSSSYSAGAAPVATAAS